MLDQTNPKGLFLDTFSRTALEQFLRAVFDAYSTAFDQVNERLTGPREFRRNEFASYDAHYLYPHERKVMVDRLLRDAALLAGMVSKPQLNKNNSSPHTVVIHGSIILTPHHVDNPHELVRPADYRTSYFRNPTHQLWLVGMDDDLGEDAEAPSIDDPRYAFLIHGTAPNPRFPAFADIVFPVKDCEGYHQDRIQLFRMFSDLVNSRVGGSVSEESIPDQDLPLRSETKRKGS